MKLDLDELERLSAAATPGPWRAAPSSPGSSEIYSEAPGCGHLATFQDGYDGGPCEQNAAFTAAARTKFPALIAYARELEAHVVELDASRATLSDESDAAIARAERVESACAQMRAALDDALEAVHEGDHAELRRDIRAALASDVGAGWVSPEQHAAEVAAAREKALEEAAKICEADAAETESSFPARLPDIVRADREGQFIGAARCADAIRALKAAKR